MLGAKRLEGKQEAAAEVGATLRTDTAELTQQLLLPGGAGFAQLRDEHRVVGEGGKADFVAWHEVLDEAANGVLRGRELEAAHGSRDVQQGQETKRGATVVGRQGRGDGADEEVEGGAGMGGQVTKRGFYEQLHGLSRPS